MEKKIILDCLGGDNGLASTVPAAKKALELNKDINLVLVGDKEILAAEFKDNKRVEIIDTKVNIGMNEHPAQAIRTKPDSSIVLGMEALRTRGDCHSIVSAGSTGAVLTGAFMKLGRIAGVSRPALCSKIITADKKGVLVLDLGANMDCKPENLLHFAIMADIYMKENGVQNPRIALLNVGTEDEKGDELRHEAFKLLKESKLNFVGNTEARDFASGKYDIIVADGFSGNIFLKTLEGTAKLFSRELKKAVSGFSVCLGKLILAGRLLKMKKSLSEDAVGGAILLGTKKPVIKAHGNSNPTALCNAILLASKAGDMDLGAKIEKAIAN
jgi:glycerol-3-phosphate acyltransferase PlsX